MDVYVGELQKKFDRLKVLYEQYFMGIEKMEPLTVRKEMTRAIVNLQQLHVRGTGLRFKVATLIQKWSIYQSYWNRTMREIEAGRYVRHVATARRRAESKGLPFPAEEMGLHLPPQHHHEGPAPDGADPVARSPVSAEPAAQPFSAPGPLLPRAADISLIREGNPATSAPDLSLSQISGPALAPDLSLSQTPRPASSPSSPSSPPPIPRDARSAPRPTGSSSPSLPRIPGMSESEVRALHQRVVTAQRSLGEPVEMRFETLVAQLLRQVPKLLAQHECKGIRFDVVTSDGRVKLKPTPQK